MKEVENQCFKLRLKTQTWHFSGFGLCAGSRHNWCFLICERKETDLRSSWPSQLIFLFFAQFFFVLHPGGLIQKGVVSGEQQEALLASITQTNSSRKKLLLFFLSPKWLMELGNKDNKAGPEPNQRNSAAYCFFVIYKFSCCIWSLSSFGMLFNDFETLLRKYSAYLSIKSSKYLFTEFSDWKSYKCTFPAFGIESIWRKVM